MNAEIDENELLENDIDAFLERNLNKELLRFVIVGSVDDGKSTLIGRLLHDTKGVYDDQLKDASRTTETGEKAIDFARITDGLRAEREQGITIDVAYRYFSTPVRKFIVADTPGHVQYTRNMATGASTADVAIILIDARLGVLVQSRRHATIASLLGIPHLLVVVNKMDLRDYSEATFNEIKAEFEDFSANLGFTDVTFVPASALMGINMVEPSPERTPWYDGPTVLQYLEHVPIAGDRNLSQMRFPVQYVLRPNLDYRGFAGQLVSGVVRVGDEVAVMPSGVTTKVKAIDVYEGEIQEAFAPMSVTLRLEDEVDCSRGDVISHTVEMPFVGRGINADVVWMSETPLDPEKSYLIKHGTRYVRVNVEQVYDRLDLEKLERDSTVTTLKLNDIGHLRLTAHQPLVFDGYKANRGMGAFVLIDSLSNNTVGAGMIRQPESTASVRSSVDLGRQSQVSARERADRLHQKAVTLWLVGRPGSGRASVGYSLERRLFDLGYTAACLDQHEPRYSGSALLGQPRRAAEVAQRLNDAGILAICTVESLSRTDREAVANVVGPDRYVDIYVDTSAEEARKRDDLQRYDGGDIAFEAPENPALRVSLATGLDTAVEEIVALLRARDVLL